MLATSSHKISDPFVIITISLNFVNKYQRVVTFRIFCCKRFLDKKSEDVDCRPLNVVVYFFAIIMFLSDDPLEKDCPLCMELLDLDELNFFPCKCGYQICQFCWNRLKQEETGTSASGLCPACRQPYTDQPADFKPLSPEEFKRIQLERRRREQQRKQKTSESRKHLANARVVQRNLLLVHGLPPRLAESDTLKRNEYFGQFGRIQKIVVGSNSYITNSATSNLSQTASVTAYVTYYKDDDAIRAIMALNQKTIDGRILRASLGTTKYCACFLQNRPCQKADCMYLHEVGDSEASFTKEDMAIKKHEEYERRVCEEVMTKISQSTTAPIVQQQGGSSPRGEAFVQVSGPSLSHSPPSTSSSSGTTQQAVAGRSAAGVQQQRNAATHLTQTHNLQQIPRHHRNRRQQQGQGHRNEPPKSSSLPPNEISRPSRHHTVQYQQQQETTATTSAAAPHNDISRLVPSSSSSTSFFDRPTTAESGLSLAPSSSVTAEINTSSSDDGAMATTSSSVASFFFRQQQEWDDQRQRGSLCATLAPLRSSIAEDDDIILRLQQLHAASSTRSITPSESSSAPATSSLLEFILANSAKMEAAKSQQPSATFQQRHQDEKQLFNLNGVTRPMLESSSYPSNAAGLMVQRSSAEGGDDSMKARLKRDSLQEDDLGFDPFSESSKALADLVREEKELELAMRQQKVVAAMHQQQQQRNSSFHRHQQLSSDYNLPSDDSSHYLQQGSSLGSGVSGAFRSTNSAHAHYAPVQQHQFLYQNTHTGVGQSSGWPAGHPPTVVGATQQSQNFYHGPFGPKEATTSTQSHLTTLNTLRYGVSAAAGGLNAQATPFIPRHPNQPLESSIKDMQEQFKAFFPDASVKFASPPANPSLLMTPTQQQTTPIPPRAPPGWNPTHGPHRFMDPRPAPLFSRPPPLLGPPSGLHQQQTSSTTHPPPLPSSALAPSIAHHSMQQHPPNLHHPPPPPPPPSLQQTQPQSLAFSGAPPPLVSVASHPSTTTAVGHQISSLRSGPAPFALSDYPAFSHSGMTPTPSGFNLPRPPS